MPLGPAEHTEPSHIFSLWLSQWRLSILDCDSAKPVLASVLDSMLTESGQSLFWQYLEQFFNSEANRSVCDSSNAVSPREDVSAALGQLANPDIYRQLVERAQQLPSQGAKCLLEHLSRNCSLERENIAFWRIVERAIQPDESQQSQPSVRLV
jgi:hypothetical protein